MVGKSPIEWTQETWNPVVGCSIVSPGCTNCYAMKMAARIEAINLEAREKGRPHAPQYDGTTKIVNGNSIWTGKLALAGDNILLAPLRRKKPTTYFVNSMGDLFHEACPDQWIDKVFAVMALTPQHTYQVLTKRAARMRDYITAKRQQAPEWIHLPSAGGKVLLPYEGGWPTNVWLGVSTERQQEADERIPLLLQTPAAVRFISAEPLLGPIDLSTINTASPGHSTTQGAKLDWVIVGGESGHDSRPMHPDWARSLRDQCAVAGVPYFFKQWGNWIPGAQARHLSDADLAEYPVQDVVSVGRGNYCFKVGKSLAGRSLDGIEYNEMPGRG